MMLVTGRSAQQAESPIELIIVSDNDEYKAHVSSAYPARKLGRWKSRTQAGGLPAAKIFRRATGRLGGVDLTCATYSPGPQIGNANVKSA